MRRQSSTPTRTPRNHQPLGIRKETQILEASPRRTAVGSVILTRLRPTSSRRRRRHHRGQLRPKGE